MIVALCTAPANATASAQQRVLSSRLVGDDATFARREGVVTSPPYPDGELRHGDVLDGAEFPRLLLLCDILN